MTQKHLQNVAQALYEYTKLFMYEENNVSAEEYDASLDALEETFDFYTEDKIEERANDVYILVLRHVEHFCSQVILDVLSSLIDDLSSFCARCDDNLLLLAKHALAVEKHKQETIETTALFFSL